ncbi:MAG TPA: arginine deiminase-related protein [Acidimicrobiales bacterium]|nr:arginine deiminase-related protein [Acidimicrobiales bacterium]
MAWGRRYLMCPPEHFGVLYEINSWMHVEVEVDLDRAREQWESLATTVREAGAEVEVLEPVEGLPDLVFTANAGIVNGSQYVPARFRHAQRQGEVVHDQAWFESAGFDVAHLPEGVVHEGAGDALPFGDGLVSGYRTRSDAASHAALSRLTGVPVRSVELVNERLYHLDLTFCPLDGRRALVAPHAWDRYGAKVIEALVPEPLVLDEESTLSFSANSVVVGTTVVMPACRPEVGRQLEAWGFDVVVCDVSEFAKAGGACRCLTLALDVQLGRATSS